MNEIRYSYCTQCQESFPMRETVLDSYERSGNAFYCPQGHPLVVRQNDIVTQLRSSERFLQRSRDQVRVLEKQVECAKGVITRQRNRLIRGVCPYCNKDSDQIDERSMLLHICQRHSKRRVL